VVAKKKSSKRRTVQIGRRLTSVSLEDDFWEAMKEIAHERRINLKDLVASIEAGPRESNLSSDIRVFVLGYYKDQVSAQKRRTS
jgi:predicted DNA-binding ribbon-helix-helix protein